ncbi:MAG TPA: hypothetical protein VEC06_01160 [Paucimonas sp.]|nr:hypothetical protein [Paucimonas sp.]
MLYIVALAWVYVVLMMSITEHSVVAGIMTFLMYAVVPWVIILYVIGAPQRRRRRAEAEKIRIASALDKSRENQVDNDTPAEK